MSICILRGHRDAVTTIVLQKIKVVISIILLAEEQGIEHLPVYPVLVVHQLTRDVHHATTQQSGSVHDSGRVDPGGNCARITCGCELVNPGVEGMVSYNIGDARGHTVIIRHQNLPAEADEAVPEIYPGNIHRDTPAAPEVFHVTQRLCVINRG